jgi:hypothetical protein
MGLPTRAAPGAVVRIGYGVYFENTNSNELQFQRNLAPFYFNATLNNSQYRI